MCPRFPDVRLEIRCRTPWTGPEQTIAIDAHWRVHLDPLRELDLSKFPADFVTRWNGERASQTGNTHTAWVNYCQQVGDHRPFALIYD